MDKMEEEVLSEMRSIVVTNVVIAVGALAGAGLYMLGRNRGNQLGYIRGRVKGYTEAVSDIAEMVREENAKDS